MRKSTAFALAAAFLAAVGIRLSPLLGSLYWGSDFGEYFSILHFLNVHGQMPSHYLGWGTTYPYFPGMFFVQEAFAGIGAVDLPTTSSLVVPVLGAIAVLPIFLVAAEITRDERVALFAAAFIAGVFPHVYPTSHTAPSTLGDFLVLAALLLFVRLRRDPRTMVPLLTVTAALVVTHHLSTYFLILMVLGTILLRGLLRPVHGSAGLRREIAYAGFLLAATFTFWFGYATAFREYIVTDVDVKPWWLLLVAFALLLALAASLVVARRRVPWWYAPRYPGLRRSASMYGAAFAFVLGFAVVASVATIPGTGISIPPGALPLFAPFFLLVALSSAGRKFFDFLAGGVAPTAWFLALAASALLGTVVATRVLIPYRHIEYLVVPLAVLAGMGFLRLLDLRGLVRNRRAAALALCGALLAANFAVAIPPPNFVANWNEGTSARSLDGAYWARENVGGLVLADHRASTILFGFGGVNATWDTTRTPFFASTFADAKAGLTGVFSPSGDRTVRYVWIDADEIAGVQLRPTEPAMPMPPAAVSKFSASPFIKVFDSGYSQVYWIAWGCDGSC